VQYEFKRKKEKHKNLNKSQFDRQIRNECNIVTANIPVCVSKQQFNILQYYIEHAAKKYIHLYLFSLTILFIYLSLFIYQIETDLI